MSLLIVFIVLGFILLIYGANWIINGARLLAKKHNISDLVIGLTVVAFGTSAPELFINGIASFNNQSDIVIGNVLGSNVFNLFAILGIVGIIYPISVEISTIKKEIPTSLISTIFILLVANNFLFVTSGISRLDGVFLLVLFGGFLFYIFNQMKNDSVISSTVIVTTSNFKIWGFILLGLLSAIVGGKIIVENASELASMMGVSEKIIGLTIVAAGTSLPELVTSVVAAFKKNSNIAIGTIIGSNIFNLLLVLGTSALIEPISYNVSFNNTLYFLVGGTVLLLIAMFTGKRKILDRWEAILLLLGFLIYSVLILKV